jgi:hypothetical protein
MSTAGFVNPGAPPSSPQPDPLADLGLSVEDRQALARQGFVAEEYRSGRRGRRGPYYRLHWRHQGRQRVRYLGKDLARAEQVKTALVAMQSSQRLLHQVAQWLAEVQKSLQRAKQILEPHLAEQGWRFHGYAGRRCRCPAAVASPPTDTLEKDHQFAPLSPGAKEGTSDERNENHFPGTVDPDPGRGQPAARQAG